MLKANHAAEDIAAAREEAAQVVAKLKEQPMMMASEIVEMGSQETHDCYAFPKQYWGRIRRHNPLERILKEIRRRTKVVGLS